MGEWALEVAASTNHSRCDGAATSDVALLHPLLLSGWLLSAAAVGVY